MEELYIVDEEFEKYKEMISKIDVAIENKLTDIITQLNKACSAVAEGNLHTNLCTYVNKISVMRGQISYLTTEMQADTGDYCAEIAVIDTLHD